MSTEVWIKKRRKETNRLLDPNATDGVGFYTNWLIMVLIAANVVAVILETVDPIQASFGTSLRYFETISVLFFTIEYLGRVWSNVENLDGWHPIYDRLRMMKEPMLVVDLLAILPYYLTLIGIGGDLRFLRALRLIRLLRLLKLVRYSESMRAFGTAFRTKRDQLIIAFSANLILLVIASSLMFFAEGRAQPSSFGSIPDTMWWAIVTLTTVGYGDVAPITTLGRILGGIVAVLGIGLFALPASILASGFIQESSYQTGHCPDCGHKIDWERDIASDTVSYTDGQWVRIDVTQGSRVDYSHHGKHGELRVNEKTTNTVDFSFENPNIAVDLGEETVDVSLSDLRDPYLPRSVVLNYDLSKVENKN